MNDLPPLPPLATTTNDTSPPHLLRWRMCIGDYLRLTKPRVVVLLLLTTLVAIYLASETTSGHLPSSGLVLWTLIGGYLAAGGAGAINCALDCDIDGKMSRTCSRPVPDGRITVKQAWWFGAILVAGSAILLSLTTTPTAALLALIGVLYYTLIYTYWLKRKGWYNVVIGGGAGAVPPLVGWAAVAGTLSPMAWILFAIVFLWTPTHFWTLALVKQEEYARAGVPMLPVVAGERTTHRHIMVSTAATVVCSLLLPLWGMMGMLYAVVAVILGGWWLRDAYSVMRRGDVRSTWNLYRSSLLYLALLFATMLIEAVVW